jgi:NAD(P)-dependent dehydrogenase (short-subunit alcohol dehydrogenase family)
MGIETLAGKLGLVTGAASGVGRSVALALAKRGLNVVICCDTDEAGLEVTAKMIRELGVKPFPHRVDVSNAEQMQQLADRVHREHGPVDVLVNNAGISLVGGLLDMTLEDWRTIVGTNLFGVIHGCHFFLPEMVKRKSGHVVNTASASAFVAFAASVAYSATKFAVLGLSEGLREELAPHGIGVTAVCPGMLRTGAAKNAIYRGKFDTSEMRKRFAENLVKKGSDPEELGETIMRAIEKNRALVTPTTDAWAMYLLKRISPDFTQFIGRKIAAQMERG